jgi:Flp pilus assembly protein TadB
LKTQHKRQAEEGALEEVEVSQEQSETQETLQVQEQPGAEEVLVTSEEIVPEESKKKRVKKKKLTEADVQPPKPSIWPLALALAIVVMMAGSAFGAIFLGIGAVLVVACVIGWALERRY